MANALIDMEEINRAHGVDGTLTEESEEEGDVMRDTESRMR